MNLSLTRETPKIILQFLKDKTGYDFSGNKSAMLERIISRRVNVYNFDSLEEYYRFLQTNTEELEKLVNHLTINVSRFFRNSFVFEIIEHEILPVLYKNLISETKKELRIWSAGCASGEEPYSLAILLYEYVQKNRPIQLQFFASDIDTIALKAAESAVYKAESLLEVKFGRVSNFFNASEKIFELKEEIRNMVHFYHYDLLDKKSYTLPDSVFGGFDLILCRNVLIYFEPEYQKLILEKLYRSLNQGGFLILGEAEMPVDDYVKKFDVYNSKCRIFIKHK